MGVRELRNQAGRYVLAAICMLIGVLAIAAVAIVNSVALDMLVAQQEQLNGRDSSYAASFTVEASEIDGLLDPNNSVDALSSAMRESLDPHGANVALVVQRSMLVATPSQAAGNEAGASVVVTWVDGDIQQLQRLPVIQGSLPHGVYPPGIALNEAAARAVGYPAVTTLLLSDTIPGQPVSVSISGVVADAQPEPAAYGDLALLRHFFPRSLVDESVKLRVQGAGLSLATVNDAITAQFETHGFSAPEGASRVDTVDSVRNQVDFLRTVFGACALAILLIAAIGTANVGLSSVAERSRELVIRRALGARRRDIFAQLISGALAVGALISAVSVALTIVAVYHVVPSLIPAASSVLAPEFPWAACASGIAAAMVTAVVGGLLPAIKATRLPVALALRE